jgi:hypothetical protein
MKTTSASITFGAVSPEVMNILTGGALRTSPDPSFAIEVHTRIKRTFWQWLTRKPSRYRTTYIPNARLVEREH